MVSLSTSELLWLAFLFHDLYIGSALIIKLFFYLIYRTGYWRVVKAHVLIFSQEGNVCLSKDMC